MDWQKAHDDVNALVDGVTDPDFNGVDFEDVCATVSDLWVFPKGRTMKAREVLRCWKLVEYVRENGFPEKL